MGTQQLLLLVLGTIVVAIAIGVGIAEFKAYHVEAVGDEIQEQLMNLAAEAIAYAKKPATLGGGGGSFGGYQIPRTMQASANATYDLIAVPGASGAMLVGMTPGSDMISMILQQNQTSPEFTYSISGVGLYKERKGSGAF